MPDELGKGPSGPRTPSVDGLVVIGEFLGGKDPEDFTNARGSGRTLPKLGIRAADGSTFSLVCTEETLRAFRRDHVKGETVTVPLSIRPPFGSNGPIKFYVRGEDSSVGGGDWD